MNTHRNACIRTVLHVFEDWLDHTSSQTAGQLEYNQDDSTLRISCARYNNFGLRLYCSEIRVSAARHNPLGKISIL